MINSIYSHGIDLEVLKEKWSYKYDVSDEKAGLGFLIGAQDYYNIIINSCTPLNTSSKTDYLFRLVLCDTGYDECFESEVTVISYRGSFAIDDVTEGFR